MFASRRFLAGVLLLVTTACAYHVPAGVPAPVASETFVRLHGHQLRLHLSRPPSPSPSSVLLVYATGDGGWWGKDRALYSHLTTWGYPAVGFSSREYVHHLEKAPVTATEVAGDYRAIIDVATAALGFSTPPRVVLVGKSRGAGLSLAAALDPAFNEAIDGIVAAGLTREEEYVHGHVKGSASRELVMLDTYARIADLGSLPFAVIQSTRDNYVPAARARELFGADTPDRDLIPIESSDHNFGGALDDLYREMEQSLHWVLKR
jgi:fermentation-respiration switch protein FrsA (DUF1100 family)